MRRGATWLCLALIFGSACKLGSKKAPPPPPPVQVLVAPVAQRDVPVERIYVGTLAGYFDVEIRARVEGYLLGQHYKEGTFVEKDQLLFQIDPAPFLAALHEAQGTLASARAERQRSGALAKRLEPLAKDLAVSKQDLDNAQASHRSASASVKSAEALVTQALLNLSYTKVTSPIVGLAGAAQVRLGNLVGAGTPTLLATVSQIDPIRAIFPITERDYLDLAQSGTSPAKRSVRLELMTGVQSPQEGWVSFADRHIDSSTGTLSLEAFFPNADAILRPGQTVRIHVVFQTIEGALVVQQRSISELQGLKRIAVVGEDDVVHFVQVKTGPQVGAEVVVTGPLEAGQQVVVEGVEKVKDGETVQPRPAAPLKKAPPPKGAPNQSGGGGGPGPGRHTP
ncbi:efflux RND transporter periplasmic adaptor subunit [Vulgatibacter incomptus]|uniref:RND efflux system, membrane fusion protein CmeA n=1 Tax=Vulgatibacter incomptus TaxID=1391653 RepID=A0A0K1PAL0_9BACT|nr:efflux RND transporter periplasmic adaptor subunit [Vulgatibacter incomptus]AKU90451.1 RND efflux system, membrane fusion protein CmeA [Vulgatibacter incomptus]